MASTMNATKGCVAPAIGMGKFSGLRRTPATIRKPQFGLQNRCVGPAARNERKTALNSTGFVEVAQVAVEQSEIFGPAAIVFACTLVGLAAGFVLLRVESLVEEGKIEI